MRAALADRARAAPHVRLCACDALRLACNITAREDAQNMILSTALDILQVAALIGVLLVSFQVRDRIEKVASLLEKK
jgi:hypothetical protein